jgi:elongation factor Ts
MKLVKELRDRTQAGLNDCRSALVEADGNMDQAVEVILKKGLAKSAKRASKVTAEGVVSTRVADDKKSAVIVEVNIQTDFAARNGEYLAFVEKCVEAAGAAADNADLGAEPYPGGDGTVEENRAALVGRLGENITVRRWARLKGDLVTSYVHMGGKIGVLFAANGADAAKAQEFLDNSAMQVAAMAPPYLDMSEIPAADIEQQSKIFKAQLEEEGKVPAERMPQVIEGKIKKWAKEVCLLEQASVLEPKKSVATLRDEVGQVVVVPFVRFERGEGIETEAGDFAAEVAAMASN